MVLAYFPGIALPPTLRQGYYTKDFENIPLPGARSAPGAPPKAAPGIFVQNVLKNTPGGGWEAGRFLGNRQEPFSEFLRLIGGREFLLIWALYAS